MAQPDRKRNPRTWPLLAAVVLGGTLVNSLLAIPIWRPRVFGDETIYWQLGRAFAWTGHFTVRGGSAPRYGVVYPALLAIPQRLGSDQHSAYVIAQVMNALLFSLAALPTYAIARRVLSRRWALLAAALSVVLPSSIYTSTIMTENAFYPLFLTCALLMLRALERPSAARQLLVAAACAVAFLTRVQSVVLLPSYLLAAVVLAVVVSPGRRRSAFVASLRRQAPTIVVLVLVGIAALAVRGRSTLGPYHVLVSTYDLRSLVHWSLANIADIELYVGVVPLAAFGVLLVSRPVALEVRRVVVLTACLGLGLMATVGVLGASQYGLGRVHERNVFYLVPLLLIIFLVWLRAGLPRPRVVTTVVVVVVVLLPVTIPRPAVPISGEDGIATILWADLHVRPVFAIAGMVLVAAVAAAVFLRARDWKAPVAVCLVALVATTVAGERHAILSLRFNPDSWRGYGWIDRAVGPDARVVELWPATMGPGRLIDGAWADEFFNRSVRDVASADGPLPDGLPVETLTVRRNGCLRASLRPRPQYAVVEKGRRPTAITVAVSRTGRATLVRLDPSGGCLTRMRP
jgi:hypothetical protein